MASLLTFVRPFFFDEFARILVVQSGPPELAVKVANRLRALSDKCSLEGLLCEEEREFFNRTKFDKLTIVRWEERREVLRHLRSTRYDIAVVLFSHKGSHNMKLLPCLLKTRTILVFNDNLDYFPLNVWNLSTLCYHFGGAKRITSLLLWSAQKILLTPFAAVILFVSVIRLYARVQLHRFKGQFNV